MLHYIELLRAFATVLVANSHFKGVYPNDILSFGGGVRFRFILFDQWLFISQYKR